MSLKFETRFPCGNARRISVKQEDELTEVAFAPEPRGGAEALWFNFRLTETAPAEAPGGKLKLVLKHLDNLLGASLTTGLRPVYKPSGKDWIRLRPGRIEVHSDGRHDLSWMIDYPSPSTEVALCFPYGAAELSQLTGKTKGYWTADSIGLSTGGRNISRVSNTVGTIGGEIPGIYLLARQHAGETPGSWVLDGLMRELARTRNQRAIVWVVPMIDVDGIARGEYGRDGSNFGFDAAWDDSTNRHEVTVLRRDIARWKERCEPYLALEFRAPGASASDGLFAAIPNCEDKAGLHKKSAGWGNHLANFITKKYAAPKFVPSTESKNHWRASGFTNWVSGHLGICALTINAPYALAGEEILSRKCYREAGKHIAAAIVDRLKQ